MQIVFYTSHARDNLVFLRIIIYIFFDVWYDILNLEV